MQALLLVAVLYGADDRLSDFVKRCEAHRGILLTAARQELAQRSRKLAMEKKGTITGRNVEDVTTGNISFFSADVKKQQVAQSTQVVEELKQRVAALQRGDDIAVCVPAIGELKVGAIGKLESVGEVIEVVDTNNAIVAVAQFTAPTTVVRGGQLATADPKRLPDKILWLKKPTAGMTTGAKVDLSKTVVEATETKTYDAIDGKNTVIVLEPFNLDSVASLWQQRKKAK